MTRMDTWDRAFAGPPIAQPSLHPDRATDRARGRSNPDDDTPTSRRRDIQGIRAVAVVLVILFHAGWSAVPGGFVGVDVFFVISGFLITGNIARGLQRREFNLLGFYANRARRLLPAAFATIGATSIATYFILPPERFDGIARDALASAYYGVNWRLANQSVDYLAQGQSPSPFQHFWSLAVEEQYYLVWPLLLIIATAIGRLKPRARVLLVISIIAFVPSFAYSILYTDSNPAQAYFVTTTRVWELALGGAVSLAMPMLAKLPRYASAISAWTGVAAVLTAAIVYTGSTPFPGVAAALPTVGAAATIACGPAAGSYGPIVLLGRTIPVFLGNISYSLYLWHWPIIVFVGSRFSGGLPLWAGLVGGAASVVPAYLSYRVIEQPALRAERFSSIGAGLGLGFITSLASAIAAMALILSTPSDAPSTISVTATGQGLDTQGRVIKVGAEVLGPLLQNPSAGAPRDEFTSITPSPLSIRTSDVPLDSGCTAALTSSADVPCIVGDAQSATTIDIVGDSHAIQWAPAFDAAGVANHWHVRVHAKAACPFTKALLAFGGKPYTSCQKWNRTVTRAIIAEHPRLAIFSDAGGDYVPYTDGSPVPPEDRAEVVQKGYEDAFRVLRTAGIAVAVIAETPVWPFDVPSCVTEHIRQLTACSAPRAKLIAQSYPIKSAARSVPGVRFVDLNRVVCPTTRCAPVIGGILLYRDTNHVGATYMRTASRYVGERFRPLIAR